MSSPQLFIFSPLGESLIQEFIKILFSFFVNKKEKVLQHLSQMSRVKDNALLNFLLMIFNIVLIILIRMLLPVNNFTNYTQISQYHLQRAGPLSELR